MENREPEVPTETGSLRFVPVCCWEPRRGGAHQLGGGPIVGEMQVESISDTDMASMRSEQQTPLPAPARNKAAFPSFHRNRSSTMSDTTSAENEKALQQLGFKMDAVMREVNTLREKSNIESAALGRVIGILENAHQGRDSSRMSCLNSTSLHGSNGSPTSPQTDEGYKIRESQKLRDNSEEGQGSLLTSDPEVQQLLHSDKALRALLEKLKSVRQQADLRRRHKSRLDMLVLSPDSRFRSWWNVILALLLVSILWHSALRNLPCVMQRSYMAACRASLAL